jgi:hypothetical protein
MKGPVVRLGPNEVAVNSIAYGVGTAHGHGLDNLDKTPWYNFFVNHGYAFMSNVRYFQRTHEVVVLPVLRSERG